MCIRDSACRAKLVSASPPLGAGTDRVEDLMPTLGVAQLADTGGGVALSRVDNSVLSQNCDSARAASRDEDGMIRAASGGSARGGSARDAGAQIGLVATVLCRGGGGGDGLPGGLGVPRLLEGDDSCVVVGAQGEDGRPIGLEAGDIEADQVNGAARAVTVGGAGVSSPRAVSWGGRPEDARADDRSYSAGQDEQAKWLRRD